MTSIDLEQAKKAVLSAAALASKHLTESFETGLTIEAKGRADFVTNLDHECEDIIRQELANFDDTIGFVGEESSFADFKGSELDFHLPSTCFIVDPVDGTSNLMHSFPGYCVSIGMQVDNELVLGVVQAPSLGKLFVGQQGAGSYRYDNDGSNEMKLKTIDDGDDRTLFASSVPFRHPEHIERHSKLLTSLYEHFEDIRRVGSAALDLSWVSQGVFGIYVERFLKPWDSAAGAVILREAGGTISDWSGNERDWLTSGEICATASARLHEKVLGLLE